MQNGSLMTDDAASAIDWRRVAHAFVSPIRVSIREAMDEKRIPLSATELQRLDRQDEVLQRLDLSSQGLPTVSYHLKTLREADLVQKTHQRQVRGSYEKFYVLK